MTFVVGQVAGHQLADVMEEVLEVRAEQAQMLKMGYTPTPEFGRYSSDFWPPPHLHPDSQRWER